MLILPTNTYPSSTNKTPSRDYKFLGKDPDNIRLYSPIGGKLIKCNPEYGNKHKQTEVSKRRERPLGTKELTTE